MEDIEFKSVSLFLMFLFPTDMRFHLGCGSGSWKRSFFCRSGSAKNLPLPYRLFDLKSNLAKKLFPFPNVDQTVKLHYKSE